jgi:hypothetical protein
MNGTARLTASPGKGPGIVTLSGKGSRSFIREGMKAKPFSLKIPGPGRVLLLEIIGGGKQGELLAGQGPLFSLPGDQEC